MSTLISFLCQFAFPQPFCLRRICYHAASMPPVRCYRRRPQLDVSPFHGTLLQRGQQPPAHLLGPSSVATSRAACVAPLPHLAQQKAQSHRNPWGATVLRMRSNCKSATSCTDVVSRWLKQGQFQTSFTGCIIELLWHRTFTSWRKLK